MKGNSSGPGRGGPRPGQSRRRRPTEAWLFAAPTVDELSFVQKSRLVTKFAVIGGLCAVLFSVYFLLVLGSAAGSVALLLSALAVGAAPLIVWQTRSLRIAGNLLAATLLGISVFITYLRGGLPVTSMFYLALIPLVVRYLIGSRSAWAWTSLCVTVVLAFYLRILWGFPAEPLIEATPSQLLALDFLGVIGLIALIHVLVSAYDESKRRSAERERQKVTDRLRQARRLESIGRLASGVAHDFNNLLTVIFGGVDHILQVAADNAAVVEAAREIEAAGDSAAELTRQLLLFSREEEGEPEVLDVGSAVTGTYALLSRSMRDEIKVELKLGQGLWPTRIDRGQLEQVLLNLTVNASDAMPAGGTLTIETSNVHLNDRFEAWREGVEPGRFVVITVIDDGTGMPPEVLEHLFEPFFTTKEKERGTGLGLATVYGIVKKACGAIWVESVVGKGTAFRVYLPAAGDALTEQPDARPESSQRSASDGTPLIRKVLTDSSARIEVRQTLDAGSGEPNEDLPSE